MLDSSLLKAFPDDLFTELDQKVFDTSLNTPDKLYNALPQKLRNVRVVSDKREQVFQLFKQKQKDIKGKSKKEKKQQIYQTPITDSNVKSEVKTETILDFPFRSKLAAYLAKNDGVELEKKPEFVSDVSLSKSVNKYKKPNYSPFRNSWEIDIMFAGEKLYLVFLNINTRYAIIEPIKIRLLKKSQMLLQIFVIEDSRLSMLRVMVKKDSNQWMCFFCLNMMNILIGIALNLHSIISRSILSLEL